MRGIVDKLVIVIPIQIRTITHTTSKKTLKYQRIFTKINKKTKPKYKEVHSPSACGIILLIDILISQGLIITILNISECY